MEEISDQIKKMEVITKRKELARAFLTDEKDEDEAVEDLKDKENEQDQHSLISQLLVRDEDLKDEEHAEDEDLKVLKPFLGEATNYGNGEMLLTGVTPSEQSTASKKSCDATAEQINEALLSQTFPHLLRHICDMFSNLKDEGEIRKAFLALNITGPYLYSFAQLDRDSSRKHCADLLTEKYNEYQKKPNQIPDMGTLIFFKLALFVYPTFLVSHPVTTSCLTFMSEIVTTCKFENAHSISRGLFVCTLISEYTLLSKRSYVPVAVNFLRGILFLSVKTTILNPIEPVSPFDLNKDAKILILEDDCSKLDASMKMSVLDLLKDSIDNGFKIRTLLVTVVLLERFFANRNEMGAQESIFKDHIQLLSSLELELYPERVVSTVERFVKDVKGT